MRQLFKPGADAVLRLFLFGAAASVIFGLLIVSGVARSTWLSTVGVAPEQPVPFSHKHHVAELGIDCRNCHQQAEQLATAGLPPTQTCMTCHSQIWTEAKMLAPVRDSLARDEAIQWVRVNRLPDYVYFNHSIHVAKGVGCSTCHGAVDRMQLTARAQPFEMQWCLQCHREPQKFLRPPSEIWNTEWKPPADQARAGAALVIANHVRDGAQLSDCSICHR